MGMVIFGIVLIVGFAYAGSHLLGDRMGVNALARFDRDVLAQPGIKDTSNNN